MQSISAFLNITKNAISGEKMLMSSEMYQIESYLGKV